MKRNLILSALAVLALVACTKVENHVPVSELEAATPAVPMDFGIYMPQTKAGSGGAMDNTKIQETGFGVFAYVKAGDYDRSIKPNFMFNQLVSYSSSNWSYSPVKYWPNQLTGSDAQKVSFFAYAPYVETAGGTEGIVAMYDGSIAGDPTVTYKVSEDLNKNVDLVWGVSNGGTWTNVAGGANTVAEGLPYLDLQKPSLGTKVHFRFYHALAQLNLTAVGAYNVTTAGGTPKDGVRVTIKEVVLTVPGMYDQAVLNLNNTEARKPLWDFTGASTPDLTLTVSGDQVRASLKDAGAVKAANQPAGVTAVETPVLAANKYFTLIPKSGSTTVTVKVTYFVTTDDPNLDGGFSRVENVISKNITFPAGFPAGTKNSIRMILGLTEVSLSAEVVDWDTDTTAEVNLPQNN
ncbi:MAG: fimbrillin family protein [Bacteroidales bacterium]|nr:fimbrillin family protein [Bacteroidales bacterium]